MGVELEPLPDDGGLSLPPLVPLLGVVVVPLLPLSVLPLPGPLLPVELPLLPEPVPLPEPPPLPPELGLVEPLDPEPVLGSLPPPWCVPLGGGLVDGGGAVWPPLRCPEELGACGGAGVLGAVKTGAATAGAPYELVVGVGPSGNR